ncbi:MAG: cytochrome c biogenesis protein ResB [Elusimicrobia bacterium]|nr:cytochrome c biogenesis protein ResB [Elusimicrobiota bacterium]
MRLFRSVRFNIFLGALITLASAVGTLLPQVPEAPEKADAFMRAYPNWGKLFDFFGLFNLYQSWWFMGLLALMAIDVVLCKLWSSPPDMGLVALPPELTREQEVERHLAKKEAALRLKPFQAFLVAEGSTREALARAQEHLRGSGYHLAPEFTGEGGAAFVATRHRLQRWGSYLAHIALVVILLGALMKGVWGFVEMVPVLEGRSRPMQNKPDWEIFVDKFTVRYYDGTLTPKLFSSQMKVRRGEELLGSKIIYVNDPLDIKGVRFYQASWGAGGMFRSATLKVGKQTVVLPQRGRKRIPGSPFEVEADVMMPNFAVSAGGQVENASLDLKNPAVRFIFHVGPHRTSPLWLFQNDPKLCLVEGDGGTLSRAPEPPFQLAALDPILFSGIQVAYDPGYKVVLFGSALWLFGMICLFYLHRRRLWILLEPQPGGVSQISVGGWSSRGPREFEKEFESLMRGLREKLGAKEFRLSKSPLVEVS